MLSTTDRSNLVSFTTRVSALGPGHYVAAKRGRSASRVEQIWRIDPPSTDDGFRAGDLFHGCLDRLIGDPSELPTFLWACRQGGGERIDTIRIEPADLNDPGVQDASMLGQLTHALTRTHETTLQDVQMDKRRLQEAHDALLERYDELMSDHLELTREAAGLQVMVHHGLEAQDPMVVALEQLAPVAKTAIATWALHRSTSQPKQITGPTSEAPTDDTANDSPSEDEETGDDHEFTGEELDACALEVGGILKEFHDQVPQIFEGDRLATVLGEVGLQTPPPIPKVTTWTPDAVEQVVALVEDLAGRNLELLTDDHMARLVEPLQGRVVSFLMG